MKDYPPSHKVPKYSAYKNARSANGEFEAEERRYTIDPPSRLKLVTVGAPDIVIEAQFNPKEVQVDANVPWAKHRDKNGVGVLEYTGREPRTVSLELLLDGAETATGIGAQLALLESLHSIWVGMDVPPTLILVWGKAQNADLPTFPLVMESLGIKRTMYSRDGKCLRATATLKLKEVIEGGTRLGKKK